MTVPGFYPKTNPSMYRNDFMGNIYYFFTNCQYLYTKIKEDKNTITGMIYFK